MTAFEGLSPQTPVLDWFFRHKTRLKKVEHLQGEETIRIEPVFRDREKLLKFKDEVQKFAKLLKSLE